MVLSLPNPRGDLSFETRRRHRLPEGLGEGERKERRERGKKKN